MGAPGARVSPAAAPRGQDEARRSEARQGEARQGEARLDCRRGDARRGAARHTSMRGEARPRRRHVVKLRWIATKVCGCILHRIKHHFCAGACMRWGGGPLTRLPMTAIPIEVSRLHMTRKTELISLPPIPSLPHFPVMIFS